MERQAEDLDEEVDGVAGQKACGNQTKTGGRAWRRTAVPTFLLSAFFPKCHGCHGLPRLVPRVESDKTPDFIGLPRVPRPFTPLGVGAPFRWSKLAISQSRTPEAGNLTSATLPGIFGYVLTHHVSRITPSNT